MKQMEGIEEREGAIYVQLYASPRASKTKVAGWFDGRVKLQVAAPPVDGAANEAIESFLASALGVGRGSVKLVSGQSGKRKVARVEGVSVAQVLEGLGLSA